MGATVQRKEEVVLDSRDKEGESQRPGLRQRVEVHNNKEQSVSWRGRELSKTIDSDKKTHADVTETPLTHIHSFVCDFVSTQKLDSANCFSAEIESTHSGPVLQLNSEGKQNLSLQELRMKQLHLDF